MTELNPASPSPRNTEQPSVPSYEAAGELTAMVHEAHCTERSPFLCLSDADTGIAANLRATAWYVEAGAPECPKLTADQCLGGSRVM